MSQSTLITSIGEELNQSPIAVPAGSDLFALYKRGVQRKMSLTQLTTYLTPLIETGWDDLQGPAASGLKDAGMVTEAFADTAFTATFWEYDRDDAICWTLQTSHRWNRTALYFHIHICPMADPAVAQVIRFDGSYAWAAYGQVVPLNVGWTAITAVSHTVSPGDLRKATIVPLATIPPPSPALESDILLIRVRRPGLSDALDTYQTAKPAPGSAKANVCIISGDAHYQVNKAGTATEIPTP